MDILFQWLKIWCILQNIVFAMASPEFYHINSSVTLLPSAELHHSSYFGFSSSYNKFNKTLLVSAPNADRIGKLFKCDIKAGDTACDDVTPSYMTDDLNRDAEVMEKESFRHSFWLGATVRSGPDSNMMMVCAPRYATKTDDLAHYTMKGRCYYSLKQDDWSIMYDVNREIFFGSAEDLMHTLGWSVDVTKYKTIIGGPGMGLYRTGLAAVFNNKDDVMPNVLTFIDVKTPLGPKGLLKLAEYKKLKNFGFSVTIGNFYKENENIYAVSSTYGYHGVGMVFLFKTKSGTEYKENEKIELNDQGNIGSMFGAELCSIKNKEKLSFLLIGAPAFGTSDKYNAGAVYMYSYSKNQRKMINVLTIEGNITGSYFGNTMVNLGDIDGDQYEDAAIAAPYADEGEGTVYIYSGADLANSNTKPLQTLKPLSRSKNFGLSLSTLKDYDENGCNELAIGAPSTDVAVKSSVAVYKCYAFITIKVNATISNLHERGTLTPVKYIPCLYVTYPNKAKSISAKIKVAVKIEHNDARFINETTNTKVKTYDYNVDIDGANISYCNPIIVNLPSNGDYNEQLKFVIKASLVDSPMQKNEFGPKNALLSSQSSLTHTQTASAANCTNVEKCQPELSLNVTYSWDTNKAYLADTSKIESFQLELFNSGEVAYAACIVGSVRGVDVRDVPSGCERDQRLSTRFKCKFSKHIATNKTSESKTINLDFSSLNSDVKSFEINFWVYDYNCPTDLETVDYKNTTRSVETILSYDYNSVKLNGKCNEGEDINATVSEIDTAGKRITHFYDIKNEGVTDFVHLHGIVKIKKDPNYDVSPPTVVTDLGKQIDCEPIDSSDEFYDITKCSLESLRHGKNIRVHVPLDVKKGITEIIMEKNLTITTEFTLVFADEKHPSIQNTITSTISIIKGSGIPVWVIVLSVILGLLLLILIIFLMFETGCLKRKKHEKLMELKKEVRRQSVRRSMMLRDSVSSGARRRSGGATASAGEGDEVLVEHDRLAEIDEAQEAASQDVVNDLYISADSSHQAQVHPHPKIN